MSFALRISKVDTDYGAMIYRMQSKWSQDASAVTNSGYSSDKASTKAAIEHS
jgi:hypothetical protein